MRSTLPSRSPTTRSSCAAATRTRGTVQDTRHCLHDRGDDALGEPRPRRRDRAIRRCSHRPHAGGAGDRSPSRSRRGARADNALLRDGLVALACASRSLASAVVADDSMLDPLRAPDGLRAERTLDDVPGALARVRRARRGWVAALEAPRAAAHRGARPARRRRHARGRSRARRARAGVRGGRARDRRLRRGPRGHRHGQAGWARAQLRERHRRAVRARGRCRARRARRTRGAARR